MFCALVYLRNLLRIYLQLMDTEHPSVLGLPHLPLNSRGHPPGLLLQPTSHPAPSCPLRVVPSPLAGGAGPDLGSPANTAHLLNTSIATWICCSLGIKSLPLPSLCFHHLLPYWPLVSEWLKFEILELLSFSLSPILYSNNHEALVDFTCGR